MAGDVAARLSGLSYTFRRPHAALERIMGIEPTFAAWEAAVLPMNYIRIAPCRNFTGAPLRERRACTYGPRLEGRRILRAASAPLVGETGVEPENRGQAKNPVRAGCESAPCPHDFRPYCLEWGGCRLIGRQPPCEVKDGKQGRRLISPLILLYDTPPRGFLTFRQKFRRRLRRACGRGRECLHRRQTGNRWG